MKATERFLTVAVAALFLVFIAAAAYSLWARGTPSLTPFQEYADKTVASLQVGCAEREVDQFLHELDLLMTEWQDTLTLADSTPRIALSPLVDKMQTTRRAVKALAAPECGEYLQEMVVILMDLGTEGFLAFLQQQDDVYVDRALDLYLMAERLVQDEIKRFRESPLETHLVSNRSKTVGACCPLDGDWWNIAMPFGGARRFSLPGGWQNLLRRHGDVLRITSADEGVVGAITPAEPLADGSLWPRTQTFLLQIYHGAGTQIETRYGRIGNAHVVAAVSPHRVTTRVQVTPEIAYIFSANRATGANMRAEDVEAVLNIAASIRME